VVSLNDLVELRIFSFASRAFVNMRIKAMGSGITLVQSRISEKGIRIGREGSSSGYLAQILSAAMNSRLGRNCSSLDMREWYAGWTQRDRTSFAFA
jgi:hypothetical protein